MKENKKVFFKLLVQDRDDFLGYCKQQGNFSDDNMEIIKESFTNFIHSFLVGVDGGSELSDYFLFNIVDKENDENIVRSNEGALHELFFEYLFDNEKMN